MDRVKLQFPEIIHYKCTIPILIQHINYGNHVGNDSIVSLLHHARVAWLNANSYSELSIEGVSLIMADLQVQYKSQLFLHQEVIIEISIANISANGFSIYYKMINNSNQQLAVLAKTNMLFFDYQLQKITATPLQFKEKFEVVI
jgi:acyl-CoA thioester hydrolase